MTIFIIVVGTSCSLNSSYYNTISVEETEKNFYEYIDNLSDYNNSDVITEWNFKGRKGFINYSLYNGDTLLFFDLYNQIPDELSPSSKSTDKGYEKYRLEIKRKFAQEKEVCNFNDTFGELTSIILSKVADNHISSEVIEKAIRSSNIDLSNERLKYYTSTNKLCQKISETQLYIKNNIWCKYELYYNDGGYRYFTEKIVFGGENHNNYTNLKR